MTITVNGTERDIDDDSTVAALLVALELTERRVAVAVNRDIVPRADHGTHRLNSGDKVEIVHAVQGG